MNFTSFLTLQICLKDVSGDGQTPLVQGKQYTERIFNKIRENDTIRIIM